MAEKPFDRIANEALIGWKRMAPTLDDGDRGKNPYSKNPCGPAYPICLPIDRAALNLLPEARELALARFKALGIVWHDGTPAGPSNHLRSSQVQCVNALMPFVQNGEALAALFGPVLPIGKVLPFGDPGAPDDLVVFEWIGMQDHLGEGGGKPRTRGANTTSVDASIKYEATDGAVEIALVEWKYTESYPGGKPGKDEPSHPTRAARYTNLWQLAVRDDLIAYDELFVEPFYQLLRQQILAHEMETAHELGADRVRLVYAAPARNTELWSSLPTPALRAVAPPGETEPLTDVRTIWQAMQRTPDRFDWLDTACFIAAGAPTSDEFKDRYGHLAVEA